MTETAFDVQGNPIVRTETQSEEDFASDQLAAIEICAANIDSIVSVATNTPQWLLDGQASASAAAQSATDAQTAQSGAISAANGANSARDSAQASATAASSSSANAAASANTAAASSADAATSATNAADSAASIDTTRSLPPGGAVTQALRKASINNYDATWQNDPQASFLGLSDVDGSARADNYVVYWDNLAQKVKFRPPNASSTLTGLSDVNILSVQDKQYVGWDEPSGKFTNLNFSGGGTVSMPTRPRIIGPATYTFTAADVGTFTDVDCLAGPVNYLYDDSVVHNVDTVVRSVLNVIHSTPTNKLFLVGGAATGPAPIPSDVLPLFGSSGVLGTAMPLSANVAQNVTIPPGVGRSVFIIYAINPANSANPSVSPNFTFAGATANWLQSAAANNLGPRTYLGVVNLPDSPIALGTTFKANWTDYGGNGNVNSWLAMIFPCTLVEDRVPFENNGMVQQPTPASSLDSVTTIPAGKGNRRTIAAVFRRGNLGLDVNPITPSGPGVSLWFEGGTSLTNEANSEMRGCIAIRTPLAGEVDTIHFDLINTAAYSEVHFTATPVDGTMLVIGRNSVVNPAIAFDGILDVVYNSNNKRVDAGTAPPSLHVAPNDIINLTALPISIAGDAIVGSKICELQQTGGVNALYDAVWSIVSGPSQVRIRTPGTGPNIILEIASAGIATGAQSVTVKATGGELGATVLTETVNFTVTAVIPSYVVPTGISIVSVVSIVGTSPVGTKIADLSLIGGVNALYNSTWSITAGPTKVRLKSPGTGQNVTLEVGTVFTDTNVGTKTSTIQVTGGELGATVLSMDVTYDVNTTPLAAAWNLYQGTNGAAITNITGGLRMKAGSGVGGYADHNQIWNTGDSYSMPYGGKIKFTITRRDNAAGTAAGSVMMLYFGTVGDGTTGHPTNPSDWVGATPATRWEYSSFGMRVSWADCGGDPNTVSQVRTREFLAAGSPNQGTQKLGPTPPPNTQPGSFPFVKDTTYNCVVDITGNVFTFTQTNVTTGVVKTITHTDVAYSSHQIGYMGFRTMETLDMEMTNFSVTINAAPADVDLPTAEVTVNVACPNAATGLANIVAALAALPSPVTKHTDIILADGTYGALGDSLDCNANGQASGLVVIRGKDSNYNAKLLCDVKTTGNYNVLSKLRINGTTVTDTGSHCRMTRCRRYAFCTTDIGCYGAFINDGSRDYRCDYNEITVVTTQAGWTNAAIRHSAIFVLAKGAVNPIAVRFCIDHNHIHHTPAKPTDDYASLYVHAVAIGNTADTSYQPCYGLFYKNVLEDLRGSDGLFEPKTSRLTVWGNTGRRWKDGVRINGTKPSMGYPNQRRGKENTWISNFFDETITWNIMGFGHIVAGNNCSSGLTFFSGDIAAGTISGSGNYESAADCWCLDHVGGVNCGDSFSGTHNQDNNPANVRFDRPKSGVTFVSQDTKRPCLFSQTAPAVGAPTAGVPSPLDQTKQKAPGGGIPAYTAAVALTSPVLKVSGATPTEQQYITQVTTVVAGSEGQVGPWAPYEAPPAWGAGITVPA